jgi:hypothetical protein
MLACLALVLSLGGCGDSGGGDDMAAPPDMTMGGDMTLVSKCGHPGDTGNSKHIGQFCDDNTPCPMGTICSHMFMDDTFFCTFPCSACPGGASECQDVATCGENTVCAANNLGSGCVPMSCPRN